MKRPLVAAVLVAIAVAIDGGRLSDDALQPEELRLASVAQTLADSGGHDSQNRLFPVFVQADDGWLPPLPAYASSLMLKLRPAGPSAVRWLAVAAGVASIVIVYASALYIFGDDRL